jgi:hypothetical protein
MEGSALRRTEGAGWLIIIIIKFIDREFLARGSVFMVKDPAVY